MAYTPVLTTARVCAQCHTLYYAKDKRRMYCSSSCNTQAWMARKGTLEGIKEPSKQVTKGELSFSVKNIATVATGAGIATAANYLVNDAPFYEKLSQRFKEIEYKMGRQAGAIDANNRYIINFIKAVRQAMPEVDQRMRLQEQQQTLQNVEKTLQEQVKEDEKPQVRPRG